jgi:hypothetical protein
VSKKSKYERESQKKTTQNYFTNSTLPTFVSVPCQHSSQYPANIRRERALSSLPPSLRPPPLWGARVACTTRCARLNTAPPPAEGSRRVCADQESYPQPCPPTSPSGVEGRSRRPAWSQQIHLPPLLLSPLAYCAHLGRSR